MSGGGEKADLCVIGAGAAGLSVAAGAARLGLRVVLIEKERMGGDCLNSGCVPSKSLIAAADAAQAVRTAARFGIRVSPPVPDFTAVSSHIASVIRAIEPQDSQERFEGLGVTVLRGQARFTGPGSVAVAERSISARRFVIAAGAEPVLPEIEGLDPARIMHGDAPFFLPAVPAHLLVIGAGPMGLELAQAFRRLGSAVTIVESGTSLAREEPEFAGMLRGLLRGEGVDFYENSTVLRASCGAEEIRLVIAQEGAEREIAVTHVLAAAGRAPRTSGLHAECAGVVCGPGGIITDRRLRTANPRIYAAGDIVAGAPRFTHVAGYHAGIVIRNAVFGIPAAVDYSALPCVIYTDPCLARAGMTEAQARARHGGAVRVFREDLSRNDRARADGRTEGGIKLVLHKNGTILGVSILAPHAGEMIGMWSLAIAQKLKTGAVAGAVLPYPTYGESGKRAAGAFFEPVVFGPAMRRAACFMLRFNPF